MRAIPIIISICCILLLGLMPAFAQDETFIAVDIIANLQIDCVCKAQWNADGSLLAVAVWPDLQIWDTNDWKLLITISDAYANYVAWHPTKNLVATVRGGREEGIIIWDATTGEMVEHLAKPLPSDRSGLANLGSG